MLRLRHRFGEDPEGVEEVAKRLRDLVLLPGFMCDADLWADMVPDLSALGRIHYGNVYQDSTLDGMARRVLEQAPERFVLVGFSMGGFVARVLTLMAPERVNGVAFVASSARGYSEQETKRRQAGYGPGGRPPRATSGAPGLHPDRENDPVLVSRLRGMQEGGNSLLFVETATLRKIESVDAAELMIRCVVDQPLYGGDAVRVR